jgi:hypothetical protein
VSGEELVLADRPYASVSKDELIRLLDSCLFPAGADPAMHV